MTISTRPTTKAGLTRDPIGGKMEPSVRPVIDNNETFQPVSVRLLAQPADAGFLLPSGSARVRLPGGISWWIATIAATSFPESWS